MALQTSGAISLQDIETEFGGSHPISISEYYAADTGVPSSGALSLNDFYGKSKVHPVIPSYTSVLYSVTIARGTGGVGEGFWRTGAGWTNSTGSAGSVKCWGDIGVGGGPGRGGYYTYTKISGFKLYVDDVDQGIGWGATFGGATFFTWDVTANIGGSSYMYISAYSWGDFGTDLILGGHFNVGGTLG